MWERETREEGKRERGRGEARWEKRRIQNRKGGEQEVDFTGLLCDILFDCDSYMRPQVCVCMCVCVCVCV